LPQVDRERLLIESRDRAADEPARWLIVLHRHGRLCTQAVGPPLPLAVRPSRATARPSPGSRHRCS